MKELASSDSLFEAIVGHRLGQADLERVVHALSETDRNEFMDKVGGLLRRIGAFVSVSQQLTGSPSLDELLPKLISIVTEALYAERSSLFLYDRDTDELFTRVAEGEGVNEIRLPAGAGLVGSAFRAGVTEIIPDAYADERFNSGFDKKTGFRTRNILCAPVPGRDDRLIGVIQVLNKKGGDFEAGDVAMVEALASQASSALEYARILDVVEQTRREEQRMLEVVNAISSELQLDALLAKIVSVATDILHADRGSLFLYDPAAHQLWSRIAQGMDTKEIRFPANMGIAGSVFTSRESINIPDAYADERFNQAFDKKTGYRTRSILCVPIIDRQGECQGVVQILNRADGPFTRGDERRLRAFASQASIALENARLFEDVLNMRNYNESILRSLSNGVLTLDDEDRISKANEAALRVLGPSEEVVGKLVSEVFAGESNAWVRQALEKVHQSDDSHAVMDEEVEVKGDKVSVNLTAVPLIDINDVHIGAMLVFEDISREKRIKSTMSRYLPHELAEQVLADGGQVLGGATQKVTILFSDVRRFTTISEAIGARQTVSMLNEYFTKMVDVVLNHGGILDKYIGDAIMALFGTPFPGEQDADNAVRAAIDMFRSLSTYNDERQADGRDPIEIGVGIGSGEVVAGNIGSPKRMDYTVIGDAVNLAARLESATKQYGAPILLSEFTHAQLTGDYSIREVDRIRVKGKLEPVTVYEALDFHTEETFPNRERALGIHADALELYRAQDWSGARGAWQAALDLNPADRLPQIYLDRVDHLAAAPPGEGWDGVWTLTSK